jgi:hypothetical protein
MNISNAFKVAKDRTWIVNLGCGYQVHHVDPKMNATWVTHIMSYDAARRDCTEQLITQSLVMLGWDAIDAGAEASVYEGSDWRKYVRELHKKRAT